MTADFESSDPLGSYRGDLANYAVDGARASVGSKSLVNSGEASDTVILNDGSAGTVTVGKTYRFSHFVEVHSTFGKLYYLASGNDASDVRGYYVEYDTGWTPELSIVRVDGGTASSVTLASTDIPSITGRWIEIELSLGSNGVHTATLLDEGAVVVELSYDTSGDATRYTHGDFGFGTKGYSAVRWDSLREVDSTDSTGSTTSTYEYVQPAAGTTDWHVPLNENFAQIESDVTAEAERLGVSIQGGYAQPAAGTTDWHVPLNENFARIESDVQSLAGALETSPSVGGYAQPAAGTTDWHVPLNENFTQIGYDLSAISEGDAPSTSTSSDSNFIYVTESQLREQKQLVDDGVQPFKKAYTALINSADSHLGERFYSVTDNGDHVFSWDEVEIDALQAMKGGARDCALAYWFTGEDTYARRVIDDLYHWFLDPDTYMEPQIVTPGKSWAVGQFNFLPAFFFAASFVRGHPYWDTKPSDTPWKGGSASSAEDAFRTWIRDRAGSGSDPVGGYYDSLPGYGVYNNQYMWMIADMAAAGAYLEDDAIVDAAKRIWKAEDPKWTEDRPNRPWNDWIPDWGDTANKGLFKHERNRDDGFGYTRYNLNALCCVLLAFQTYDGTDLWEFTAPTDDYPGVSTVEKAFNWFAPFVENTQAWIDNGWQESGYVSDYSIREAAAVYEAARRVFGKYDGPVLDPDGNVSRPHVDDRHVRHWTLIHGVR